VFVEPERTPCHHTDTEIEELIPLDAMDVAMLILRVAVGGTFIAHGYNHAFGPGGLAGTARWFDSMGMKHAPVQAFLSAAVEIAAGLGLVLGLLTSLMAAALISVCAVATVTAHRKNGFFVFKDGYEYVLLLALTCVAVAVAGPGSLSVDHGMGIDALSSGWAGAGIAAVLGVGGAAVLLAVSWRPAPDPAPTK
jgi:putative oxidoreductase